MLVYHPSVWLAAMPSDPRFWLTREQCAEDNAIKPEQVVRVPYSGSMDDSCIVKPDTTKPSPVTKTQRKQTRK